MYLFIFEDGEIGKAKTITDDDLVSADNGDLSIIDISDPSNPIEYFFDKWIDIHSVKSD